MLCRFLFKGSNVKARNRHTAAVIQPHDHATPLRVYCGMLSAWHRISIPTARENRKGLKWAGCQKSTNICDHR